MKIAHVKISNILGITELEFTPDGFNEISGPNGTGKTSVLEAIKSVIVGGHDATLLRKGADKGEVVLVLDDGTEIRKRVTARQSPLDVVRDGKKVTRPTDVVKALTDLLSVNPIDFLRAKKQDRVKVLLEAMPLVADADRLKEITGIPVHVESGAHALSVIEAVRKQVYDDRTGTNRAVKEKDATINQLKLAMPDAPEGVDGNEDQIAAAVDEARNAKDAELKRIDDKLAGIRAEHQSAVDAIRAEAQAKIDAIKAEAVAAVEAKQAELAEIEGKASAQREKTITKFNDATAPLNQSLAVIRANRGAAAKREQALETIKQMEQELEDLKADSEAQTKALADIDAYKEELLKSLPIPGVEIIDGEIYRDGVPFDRLNTASQVGIAVEIAKLRAGELGVVCVDGLELLDPAAFDEFRDRALESNLQLFVSRVTGDEFQVKTSNNNE